MPLGRDFRTLVPCEDEIGLLSVEVIQIVLKHRLPERMDLFESIGVEKDSPYLVSVFS
jgi:hypothetical protein